MEKQTFFIGVGFLVAVLFVSGLWYQNTKAPSLVTPIATTTISTLPTVFPTSVATPEPTSSTPQSIVSAFPINSADTVSSWNFKGVYVGNDTLIAKARAGIENLRSLIGKGQYDDYDLYVGIGNDYTLLGDGASAYVHYNHAISIHPDKGLAYANLGHLMDKLGAYKTALDAYRKAADVEPIRQYIEGLKDYVRWRFPDPITSTQVQ